MVFMITFPASPRDSIPAILYAEMVVEYAGFVHYAEFGIIRTPPLMGTICQICMIV